MNPFFASCPIPFKRMSFALMSGILQLAMLLAGTTANAQLASSGWPTFRGNTLNSSLGAGSGTVNKLLWSAPVNGSVVGSPIIGPDGTVYASSSDGSLYAFDGQTGTKKWAFATGGTIPGSPALGQDGTIYVTSDKNLFALVASNASVKWEFSTYYSFTAPTIGPNNNIYMMDTDSGVICLNSTTGTVVWTGNAHSGNLISVLPTIGLDGTVFVPGGQLAVENPANGADYWFTNVDLQTCVLSLSPDGNTLYVLSFFAQYNAYDFYAFSIGSNHKGTQKWHQTLSYVSRSAPAIGPDGTLYFTDQNGNVFAYQDQGSSAKLLWQVTMKAAINSTPAVDASGVVYVGPDDGNLYALNGKTGATLWSYATAAGTSSPAIGNDGTLYVGSGTNLMAMASIHATAISLSPTSLQGGASTTATVTLNTAAPSGGFPVAISSTNPAVIAATLTVPAGATSATATVGTNAVSALTVAPVSAMPGLNVSANLTIYPPAVTGLSLSPSSVVGGNPSTGTITLAGPAGSGGVVVSISSDSTKAIVPTTATVAGGQTTGTFTVTTSGVDSQSTAHISASTTSTPQSAALRITPASLSSVSVSPTSVLAGNTSTGTVNLTGQAGSSGIVVQLKSSLSAVGVPATVTVPSGQSSVTFTASASGVDATATATITATQGTASAQASLTVTPATLIGFTMSPASVVGGTSTTGTVTLNGPAGPSGVSVPIASSSPAATPPATVSVAYGQTSSNFTIPTSGVSSQTSATITAGQGTNKYSAILTINVATLLSITVTPTTVEGGTAANGTVTLNGLAGSGGSVIALLSSSPNAVVPANVTILGGTSSTTFTANTLAVSSKFVATLSARYFGNTLNTTLTITPAVLASLTLSPTTVQGGVSSTGTVTLDGPAGPSGAIVGLSSNSSQASVPISVSVAPGRTSATFAINTLATNSQVAATITATLAGVSELATLTITPPALISVSVNPGTIQGGSSTTGTVTLGAAAGSSGVVITLTSGSQATVPPSVTIQAGQLSASFGVNSVAVSAPAQVSISASLGSQLKSTTLNLTPATLASVNLNPTSVIGGASSTGTVTLSGPAGPAGATVTLTSANGPAKVPASVNVLSGQISATFSVGTGGVTSSTPATISGSLNGISQSAVLTINPAGLASLLVNPGSIVGGNTATGTVTLNGVAGPGGIPIALSSNNNSATVPSTTMVPGGSTSTTFSISTLGVSSSATALITANLSGTSQTASLTITAAALSSISVNPNSVPGGTAATGTVSLSGAASKGGVVVKLKSSLTGVVVPASVTIPLGQASVTFKVTTTAVAATKTSTLSGTVGTATVSTSLTILPPNLGSVSVSPSSVTGGAAATGPAGEEAHRQLPFGATRTMQRRASA